MKKEIKDDIVKFRVTHKEKKQIETLSYSDGHDSITAYFLFLHRMNLRKKLKALSLAIIFLFITSTCLAEKKYLEYANEIYVENECVVSYIVYEEIPESEYYEIEPSHYIWGESIFDVVEMQEL